MLPKATDFFGNVSKFKTDCRAEILAIKALSTGTANERQQQMALAFIIKRLCRTDDFNFFPDERDTCFALGREAVGKALRGLALDPSWAVEKKS